MSLDYYDAHVKEYAELTGQKALCMGFEEIEFAGCKAACE